MDSRINPHPLILYVHIMQIGDYMEIYKGISFEVMNKNDVEELTDIMKRSFDEDTRRHLGESAGGPPGYNNGEFLRKWYFCEGVNAYKISKDECVIGGIAVWINENDINYLGNVFVDPLFQDQGIGLIIWEYIEQKYPNTKKWQTDTPGFSKRNHNFYVNKCGFKIIKINNPKDKYEESYILEKNM